jgi:flagellar biogenesis protein FliO
MKRGATSLISFCFVTLTHTVMAADTNSLAAAPSLNGPSITASLIRLVGGLLFVFAILFGGLWLVRNSNRFIRSSASAPKLVLLEVKSLGQRQALYVVAYEQQRMLLASSPAGISLITHLPEAEQGATPATPAAPSFADVLIQTVTRKP